MCVDNVRGFLGYVGFSVRHCLNMFCSFMSVFGEVFVLAGFIGLIISGLCDFWALFFGGDFRFGFLWGFWCFSGLPWGVWLLYLLVKWFRREKKEGV